MRQEYRDHHTVDQSNLYSAFNHNPLTYSDLDGRKVNIVASKSNPGFKAQAERDLGRLNNTATGRRLYDALVNSDKTYNIKEGSNNFDPNSNTVWYNPADCTSPDKDTEGSDLRPPWVGLGHEMGHASDWDKDRKGYLNSSMEEIEMSASQAENKIRSEAGIPLRKRYTGHGFSFSLVE